MFCVYILQSVKDKSLYIGYTNNLERRLAEHNENLSKYTKNKGPWEIIYGEFYKSQKDAKIREESLKKYSQAYTQLKRRLANSL